MAAKKTPIKSSSARLDEIGIESIEDMMEAGMMNREIAREIDVPYSSLVRWLRINVDRSARAREARARGAAAWDELAMEAISAIPDEATPAQISRAREMAQHYRWRASKLGRAEYGEKLQHTGADGEGPVETRATLDVSGLPTEVLAQLMAAKDASDEG